MSRHTATDVSGLAFCDEKWDEMEPAGPDRRMCARCSRPVVDMRGLTPDEVSEVYLWSDERVCGLFSPGQFAAAEPRPAMRRRSGLVTLALGASLLAARAEAQSAAPPAREHVQLPAGATPESGSVARPSRAWAQTQPDTVIEGRVRSPDGNPLAYVTVAAGVRGSDVRTITDVAGRFVLRLPADHDRSVALRISLLGFEQQSIQVDLAKAHDEIDVTLAPSVIGLTAPLAIDPAVRARRSEGFSVARITVSDP